MIDGCRCTVSITFVNSTLVPPLHDLGNAKLLSQWPIRNIIFTVDIQLYIFARAVAFSACISRAVSGIVIPD
jgi:hypothetical protein